MPPTAVLDPATIDAVIFDIGGVFLYPHPAEVQLVQANLGINVDQTGAMYRRAHHAGVAALAKGDVADELRQGFWRRYDDAYVNELGASPDQRGAFDGAVRPSWTWAHQPNIDAFHQLAAFGRPLAIVSNNDGSAQPSMVEHGVCQVGPGPLPEVAIVVDSAIVGIAKPDPAIMEPALEAIGIERQRVLYVGDTVHADVTAATSAGMQVVQLDPFDQHLEYDHPRVHDVAALVNLLA